MNAIELNPSQTLRLVKERDIFFEGRNARRDESEKIFFTAPLIFPLEENFTRENFLAIKNFSIYKIQKNATTFFFPCKIELRQNSIFHILPCAACLAEKKFNLNEFFLEAKSFAKNLNRDFFDEKNFLFRATSFKFFRAEITENSWNFFDEIWKKI
ncbi:MAG: hypothetical protein K2N58_03850 [Treponemataceae bacterium]|nr:hypothetical protein [Treponemataceae bacterium]